MTPSTAEFQTSSLYDSGSAAELIDVVCPNCSTSLSVHGVYAASNSLKKTPKPFAYR